MPKLPEPPANSLRALTNELADYRNAAQWAARALRFLATWHDGDDPRAYCFCGRTPFSSIHDIGCHTARTFFDEYEPLRGKPAEDDGEKPEYDGPRDIDSGDEGRERYEQAWRGRDGK